MEASIPCATSKNVKKMLLSYFVYRDLKGLHDMHKVTIRVVQYTIWSVRTQLDSAEAQETEYEQ